jgi:hypothetical protein
MQQEQGLEEAMRQTIPLTYFHGIAHIRFSRQLPRFSKT